VPGPNRSSGARRQPGLTRRPQSLVLCRPRASITRSAASGTSPGSTPSQRFPMPHPHVRLTIHGRRLLVDRVRAGRPIAHVAEEMGISRTTAHKWVRRWRAEGDLGLYDRSSRPLTTPHRAPAAAENRICELRRDRKLGPARIGPILGIPSSTVHRVLTRHGLNRPTLRTITSRRTGPRRHQEARQHSRRRRTSDHAPPAGRWQSAGHNRSA